MSELLTKCMYESSENENLEENKTPPILSSYRSGEMKLLFSFSFLPFFSPFLACIYVHIRDEFFEFPFQCILNLIFFGDLVFSNLLETIVIIYCQRNAQSILRRRKKHQYTHHRGQQTHTNRTIGFFSKSY